MNNRSFTQNLFLRFALFLFIHFPFQLSLHSLSLHQLPLSLSLYPLLLSLSTHSDYLSIHPPYTHSLSLPFLFHERTFVSLFNSCFISSHFLFVFFSEFLLISSTHLSVSSRKPKRRIFSCTNGTERRLCSYHRMIKCSLNLILCRWTFLIPQDLSPSLFLPSPSLSLSLVPSRYYSALINVYMHIKNKRNTLDH